MQNGQENILTKSKNDENKNPVNKRNTNPQINNSENLREKENIIGKDGSNYLKINKLNILKELFNTFEIFNKSEYENMNSKNINNSVEERWIFRKEFNKNNNFENKELNNNEDKSDLNLNRFNRLNSIINSVGCRNEKDKFEYSDKHNIYKKSLLNANYNLNNNLNLNRQDSNSPKNFNKKATNGSKNINNDTVIDMKNRKILNEMNTITLSKIDQNETLKDYNNRGN